MLTVESNTVVRVQNVLVEAHIVGMESTGEHLLGRAIGDNLENAF